MEVAFINNKSRVSARKRKRNKCKTKQHRTSGKATQKPKFGAPKHKMNYSSANVPGFRWFWDNSKKVSDWQMKHKVAFWKSQALSYKEENNYLHNVVKSLNPDFMLLMEETHEIEDIEVKSQSCSNRSTSNEAGCESNTETYVEVSREMIDWCKQMLIRKAILKKEEEKLEAEVDHQTPEETLKERLKEMKELYGEGSSKIIGMETAMQLNYNRLMDKFSPKYWPNIPLNL